MTLVRGKVLASACGLFILCSVLPACSSAAMGESCGDEGRVGGDCESGLLCARSKADDVSELVCLKPCAAQAECAPDETCSGERGRVLQACRKR
jgi:hypothetical protein